MSCGIESGVANGKQRKWVRRGILGFGDIVTAW